MSYYNELKTKNDITVIAKLLGFNGQKSGSSWQGKCPKHGSNSGKCLVIWPGIQGFRCYNCGESGDVINLVQLYRRCDHLTAVQYLAERVGMPYQVGGKEMSPEEQTQREADIQEESLVYDMLTEAASWYHQQLKHFPDIMDHLINHYGFSEDIIELLKIGFAPSDASSPNKTSNLANHLKGDARFKNHLIKTGLFNFSSPNGPYYDYFKGRIVFSYWKNGKVVNMIARATQLTPVDTYECYADKGNVKTDSEGKPEYIKYKKLRRHDPNANIRKHISKFIGMETFMGSDAIRGEKKVVITEGAPDWVSAIQHGFPAVSPVTTNFRDEDMEKLANATVGADAVYIINDNEENQAGLTGALKTGKYLTERGRKVFLVELPRPDGLSKIDLNEYLRDHTSEDLRKLMESSKSMLDKMITELPEDFIKAQPVLKAEILPLLLGVEESMREHYLDVIKKTLKTTKSVITAEFEDVRRLADKQKEESQEPDIDPAIQSLADDIAKNPSLIRHRIDMVNKSGVVGERNVVAMYFATLDSRLLPEDTASPNALATKNEGHHGSGKSVVMKKCLELYPEDSYHLITSGSAKSLYYLPHGLKHRSLIVTEAFQFQANNAPDSEFVYVVRSLLSEGRVCYQVAEKNDDGKFVTVEKRLDGPTSFITTTVVEKLEPQLEDRLFTIHPDESIEQTKLIMSMTASIKDGSFEGLDEQTIQAWKTYHARLKPVDVAIPYARQISKYLQQNERLPIATRRAFNRVLTIIQAVVCAYQFQRSKNSKGCLEAEMCDYWMALQIVREAFRETLGQQSKEAIKRIAYIRENGPVQYNKLKSEWGISKSALTGWVRGKVYDGHLVWCDKDGNEFSDDDTLKKAKHSGIAFVRINELNSVDEITGLPTPYELTGDNRWDEGGDLLELYDLRLDQRQVHGPVTTGVSDYQEYSDDEALSEETEETEQEFSFPMY